MSKKKLFKKTTPKPKQEIPERKPPVAPAELARGEPVQAPRGMRDILPSEEPFWAAVTQKAHELARSFGYGQISTPVLEQQALFLRAIGEGTDIVQKEMYIFKDQGGDTLALRPEGTAAIVRAYINHGMINLPQPIKLSYLGAFFRRERPQAGRYRQFHQWGLEALGDAHPVLDAEVISIAVTFFRELKIPVNLEINSLGCRECRGPYRETLVRFFEPKRELLCETCKVRLTVSPLRMLDCKEPQCELIREGAPQLPDLLCEPCRDHFMKVLEYLDDLAISYNLNPYLVRGLDYYTRTAFEIFPEKDSPAGKDDQEVKEGVEGKEGKEQGGAGAPERGRQSALGGGGRYDGLAEELGGRPTPAVGFSLGLERMVALLKAQQPTLALANAPRVFIAQLGEGARRRALMLWHELRSQFPVAAALSKDGLKAQLEIANRLGVRYTIIIGQKEILDQTAIVRDMEAGIQEVVDYNKLMPDLKRKLSELT